MVECAKTLFEKYVETTLSIIPVSATTNKRRIYFMAWDILEQIIDKMNASNHPIFLSIEESNDAEEQANILVLLEMQQKIE